MLAECVIKIDRFLTREDWEELLSLDLIPRHKEYLVVFWACNNRPMDRNMAWARVAARYGYDPQTYDWTSFDTISVALKRKKTRYRYAFRAWERKYNGLNPVTVVKILN